MAINERFCLLKMMKCKRRQATDPQKLKKLSTDVFLFFVSGRLEAIGVDAEAIEK